MGKRTNTATWSDKHSRWQINVQKDGKRRSFYSCTQGRTGQREANAKADAWLDNGIKNTSCKVATLWNNYIEYSKLTTSNANINIKLCRRQLFIAQHRPLKNRCSIGKALARYY